ncbi:formylglycine-generating enzyme family protein [Mariluticola halotolerans]|uniref:formylglycine-generating enzyme family protein n=1 Tax=Mariluticola halotolerans TaxID=2909283 RepID=UPI0026E352EB|nr:formylglycine-generating enzyme family protein [Mariluticola halotolerans]UJQ93392.1 formylglycine-generating enzyme family protein [Mariluticola halotolerans]
MSCCTPSRRTIAAHQAGADARVDMAGYETTGAPERAYFAATRTFVGTDNPQIAADGEGPRRVVTLKAFALEIQPVTNARFAAFVAETGYITEAERFGWSAVFRGLMQDPPPPSETATPWWVKGDGAFWAAPEGPGSAIADRLDHPVVHVSFADARAFAQWCGGRLPSEAEWEHAARGGLDDPRFPWGDTEPDDTQPLCNIWQGNFPHTNTMTDGYFGTSPVTAFAPNGAGLYGMAGNVWEWTADAFRVRSLSRAAKRRNAEARAGNEKVCKGGSFLCHKSYCYRYRIAARTALTADSSASNNGFRIAYDG